MYRYWNSTQWHGSGCFLLDGGEGGSKGEGGKSYLFQIPSTSPLSYFIQLIPGKWYMKRAFVRTRYVSFYHANQPNLPSRYVLDSMLPTTDEDNVPLVLSQYTNPHIPPRLDNNCAFTSIRPRLRRMPTKREENVPLVSGR
jgi:hypothetical protein